MIDQIPRVRRQPERQRKIWRTRDFWLNEILHFVKDDWLRALSRVNLIAVLFHVFALGSVAHADDTPFVVWATSCIHSPQDIKFGRASLAKAIRQSEGFFADAPGFDWDIAIDCGDMTASQYPPTDEDGHVIAAQFRALQKHRREQIYHVQGNHDASYYDEGAGAWFRKWIDPLGENPETSGVLNDRRPFPVEGQWDRYSFQAGNVLFLMLSDRNDMPSPVGRGSREEQQRGGFPAGAVTRATFEWWKQMVLENQDKIIITVHHHVLRDTTTASGYNEGGEYHGSSGGVEGSSYLHWIVENEDPEHFEYSVSKPGQPGPFEVFLETFYEESGRPAIDLWIGGHTHVHGPEDTTGGKRIEEQKWGVMFLQAAAVTQYHAGSHSMSRVLTLTPDSDQAEIRLYLHEPTYENHPAGWYEPYTHIVPLRHAFAAPKD